MKMVINEIEELMRRGAVQFVSEDEAAYFAGLYMNAHLHRAPRLMPIEEAVADLKVWRDAKKEGPEKTRRLKIRKTAESAGVIVFDFDGLAPGLKLKYIHDELENRAKANGIAAAGIRNSAGIITLLPWAYGLAERDLIGITTFNGGVNCCVPFGGTKGLFGTLPLAYAVPSAGPPIVADMAMTEIPFFQLKDAKDRGEPLPAGAAVDRKGEPTTNAAEALRSDGTANLLPFGGGFKGYSLALLIEILTGSLIRSLSSDRQTPGWHPEEYGSFTIAIDIGSFTNIENFKREVSATCDAIRKQQPAEGSTEVPIPGDRGRKKAAAARKAGKIEVKDEIIEELKSLAS